MTYCFVEFADVDGALNALKNSHPLVLNGRRLVVKPRELRTASHGTQRHKKKKVETPPPTEEMEEEPQPSAGRVPSSIGGVQFTLKSIEKLEQADTVSC